MVPNIRAKRHTHLDGDMPVAGLIESFYAEAGMLFPFKSIPEWMTYMRNSDIPIPTRFDTITKVLQSREVLTHLAYSYGKARFSQGHLSVEPKFAPQYLTRGGLTMREATSAVYEGSRWAQNETGIKITPQICIGREADVDLGMEIAKIAVDYDGELILDLACDEAGHPPEKHFQAYALTFNTRVKRDCHAGEWVNPFPRETYDQRLAWNVKTAIVLLKCHSVGHAIPVGKDEDLIQLVLDNNVRVVGCPMSELNLGNLKTLKELRIDYILERGVWYTFDADDDLFLPTLEEVSEYCDRVYHFSVDECRKLEENALREL